MQWLDAPPETPITGVVLANEVADALPFQRFVIGDECGWSAAWRCRPQANSSMRIGRRAVNCARSWRGWHRPAGHLATSPKLCPMVEPWIDSIAQSLARGALLLIDYGLPRHEYYHPQRDRGTLRCHFRHRAHEDPLIYPGLQDITAWVDFTRVAEAGGRRAARGRRLLHAGGLPAREWHRSGGGGRARRLERARLASQARSLLLPGEMGERFKVMALTRGLDEPMQRLHGVRICGARFRELASRAMRAARSAAAISGPASARMLLGGRA